MIEDSIRVKLEEEVSLGHKYQSAWRDLLEPFVTRKQYELFDMFIGTSSTDVDKLVAIRMQSNALESLKDEFKTFIETGALAQQQLVNEDIENGK